MSAEVNFWYVKLPDGDVHRVTLDELDGAFQSGHIDENTMVLASGADQWTRLGDLVGGEEASDGTDGGATAPGTEAPMPVPVAAQRQVTVGAPAARAQQPVVATAPHAAAPNRQVPPAYVPMATSLRPLSVDLGDASDIEYPKPRRGRWLVAAVGALVAVGAVGFAVQRTAMSSQISDTTAAAAMQPPPAPAPSPEPAAAPPATPEVSSGQHLADDLKAKLLEADKQRDAKSKSHKGHSAGGESHASAPRYKASPVFTTGGNKYDPLNSNL